jgi:hypothetical protein
MPIWERSGNGWGTLQTDTDPVFLCLTGDHGRCRNAGEDRPFLPASTVAEPIRRDLASLELYGRATGHRPGSAAASGIGLSGPNERALLPSGNEPAQQASGVREAIVRSFSNYVNRFRLHRSRSLAPYLT